MFGHFLFVLLVRFFGTPCTSWKSKGLKRSDTEQSEQPLQLLQYLEEVQHENYVDIFLVVSPGQEQDWLKF